MKIREIISDVYERQYYNKKIDISNISPATIEEQNIIFTIAFNNSDVIEQQIGTITNHCMDSYVYIVADNSSDLSVSKIIEKLCEGRVNVLYIRLPKWNYNRLNPSKSHGIALNYVFRSILKSFIDLKRVLILDHDIFPINDFSFSDIYNGQDLYGLKMQNKGIWYIWPGFMYINIEKYDLNKFDFKPGYGGDTGSSNWKTIFENLSESNMKFASLKKKLINDAPYGEHIRQSSEVDILDDAWIHMVNASDWAGIGNMDLKLKKVKELLR